MAEQLHTEIVSCDSRQFYTELDIGVARPTHTELAAAPHHFIACRSVVNPYNVYTYEQDALASIRNLHRTHDTVIATGGSGLYIEALCHGIAPLPDPDPDLRMHLQQQLHTEGVESLRSLLRQLDPDYYARVDLANGARIQRALEVCLTTGKPYSQLIHHPNQPRPFHIEAVVINLPPDQLRQRINQRVDQMMIQGLEEEARKLFPLRYLTPLNTVGYKEFFSLWETVGSPFSLTEDQRIAVADSIRLHTWHYAKKQLTWLRKFSATIPHHR